MTEEQREKIQDLIVVLEKNVAGYTQMRKEADQVTAYARKRLAELHEKEFTPTFYQRTPDE